MVDKNLTPQDLIDIFGNRKDVYALQQDDGSYLPVRQQVTESDIEEHLKGTKTIGMYCLDKNNKVKWACIDIDGKSDIESLKSNLFLSKRIYETFNDYSRMLEFSGNKGYHIWIFFKEKITAAYARQLISSKLNMAEIPKEFEIFPKQTKLTGKGLGNLVKLPLCIHKKSKKRSQILKYEIKD